MTRLRTAVLISGRGSNMAALIDARQDAYHVVLVISNRPDTKGLEAARARAVETLTIDHKGFPDREAFERALDEALRARDVELVALAGFMRVLTPYFVRRWPGRLINIHPSLLPKYPGTRTHARALEAGDKEHGCTVHLVVDEVDSGQILGQARLSIRPEDTPDTLAARVLELEHELYPRCLAQWASSLSPLADGPAPPRTPPQAPR
jgi:phosphoribosylglycinamide formyltransferase-1